MRDLSTDQWAILKALVQIGGAGLLILISGWVIYKLDIAMDQGAIIDLIVAMVLAVTGLANAGKLWKRRNGDPG